LKLYGFGSNKEMGNFLLEGFCEVVPSKELEEKEGLKNEN